MVTPEVEIFNRHYQLLRDGIETALCAGTSFVVRRIAIEEIGGFVVDSLSEDYVTGVRLSAQGYRVIYLDESLSSGLSAENMADHIVQRRRWAGGGLQAFFIKANPVTISGLSPLQRLTHHRRLVEMLFCRPGQWKRHDTPGELRSLWLLLRILLKPRALFDPSAKLNTRQFPKRQQTTTDH